MSSEKVHGPNLTIISRLYPAVLALHPRAGIVHCVFIKQLDVLLTTSTHHEFIRDHDNLARYLLI